MLQAVAGYVTCASSTEAAQHSGVIEAELANDVCRLFLSPYDLAPTYRNVHNKFSVKYYLNLVLVDEEDRRYFKQQEITLYRASESPKSAAASPQSSTAALQSQAESQAESQSSD